MLASSRLPCSLLDRLDQVPFCGLQSVTAGGKRQGPTEADVAHEKALLLAARISSVAEARQVPLPPTLMMLLTSPDAVVDAPDLPLEGQVRQVSMLDRRGMLPILASRTLSVRSSRPNDVARRVVARLEGGSALQRRYGLNAINVVKKVSSSGMGHLSNTRSSVIGIARSLARPLRSNAVAVVVGGRWEDGDTGAQGDVEGRPERPFGLQVPHFATAPKLVAGLSVLSSATVGSSLVSAIEAPRAAGSQPVRFRATERAKTALDMVVGYPSPASSRIPALMEVMPRHGVAAALSSQGSPSVLPVSRLVASYRHDLQQQAVPPVTGMFPLRHGRRLYHQDGPAAMPATSVAAVGDGHQGGVPGISPQVINLSGGVMLDGHRLGRLTASSQAREASLPARGPSRVNLRAVPIYSGMQIPS